MERKYIVVIGFLFNLVFFVNAEDLTHLLMNKEISRVEVYINGALEVQDDYVSAGGRVFVYTRNPQSVQPYISKEYIFNDSIIEVNHYYKDKYRYLYEKYTYLNNALITWEYEDLERGLSETIQYFYDNNGNLLKEVGIEFEKNYSYSFGNLVLIDTLLRHREQRQERVEQIDTATIYSPCYDLYIKMDKKIIERRFDAGNRIDTIKYILDGEIYEEQKLSFINNDRIQSIIINNSWKDAVVEYKFFFLETQE